MWKFSTASVIRLAYQPNFVYFLPSFGGRAVFLAREEAAICRFSPSAVSGFLDEHHVVLLGSESPAPQGWEQTSALPDCRVKDISLFPWDVAGFSSWKFLEHCSFLDKELPEHLGLHCSGRPPHALTLGLVFFSAVVCFSCFMAWFKIVLYSAISTRVYCRQRTRSSNQQSHSRIPSYIILAQVSNMYQ